MSALSAYFQSKGAPCLYHFTDSRNVPLIRQHGLWSWAELKARGFTPPAPGGNDWSHDADAARGLDAFVHLCYRPNHPMCHVACNDGRIAQVVWLRVDLSALDLPNVAFTLDVANKSGVQPLSGAGIVTQLDWEVLYTRTDWTDPSIHARLSSAERAEILVPRHVPANLIKFG